MEFHGIGFQGWRLAFWVVIVLAAVASAVHAIVA
jgi:hypothetical protein